MDKLRAIKYFLRLADLGSFTRVAEQTGAPKSMISKEISRLEKELGVRLFHRSTRNLKLTHVGQGYLPRAKEFIERLEQADNFVKDLQQSPKGKLKINAPMALGITHLTEMFTQFMKQYPEIELDVHFSDEDVDLVEHGFDLGFRASSKPIESSYIGKPLTTFGYHICASQEYLNNHLPIHSIADLKDHNCFIYSYFKGKNVWPIDGGVAVHGNLKVNSALLSLEAIKAGLGIGFIPSFISEKHLKNGDIVEVLPDSTKPILPLYALYPARHFVPPQVVQCIEFIEEWFKS